MAGASRRTTFRMFSDVAAVALPALAWACGEVSGPARISGVPRAPDIAVEANDNGPVPSLTVVSSEAATVTTDYWDEQGLHLRQTTPVARAATIALLRARPGTMYHYAVKAVGANGVEGPAISGTTITPELPADLAALRFDVTGTPTQPLLMLEIASPFRGFVIVDENGFVVWYWRTAGSAQSYTRLPNGDYLLYDTAGSFIEVTPAGEAVRRLNVGDLGIVAHHDVVATDRNSVLFIAQDRRVQNGQTIVGEGIWEWSFETGLVQQRWSAFDWLDPALDWGSRSTASDWLHANSLSLGPRGNVLLSMNWLGQVLSIAPDFSRVEWRLGGKRSSFAVDSNAVFLGQHAAQMLADGRVLLFDNGRDRVAPERYSRALELELDTVTFVARRVWEFRPQPNIYAPIVGAVRRSPNGTTTVSFGTTSSYPQATGPIRAYEVSPAGQATWSLTVTGATTMYRATPLLSIGGEYRVR